MRKDVKEALKRGVIRKETGKRCDNEDLCNSKKVKRTFSILLESGKYSDDKYCEDCISRMLNGEDI